MYWTRIKIENIDSLNWDTTCEDCQDHIYIAKQDSRFDLMFDTKTTHIIGVCLKEELS